MLNLSKKASVHFKCDFSALEKRNGDFWRIDVFRIGRLKYLICVHELTLYTLIRRAKGCSTVEDIAQFIHNNCQWYDQPVSIGRTDSRRILGSITDMLLILKHYGPEDSTDDMMAFVNRTPFRYINMDRPSQALTKYVNGKVGASLTATNSRRPATHSSD